MALLSEWQKAIFSPASVALAFRRSLAPPSDLKRKQHCGIAQPLHHHPVNASLVTKVASRLVSFGDHFINSVNSNEVWAEQDSEGKIGRGVVEACTLVLHYITPDFIAWLLLGRFWMGCWKPRKYLILLDMRFIINTRRAGTGKQPGKRLQWELSRQGAITSYSKQLKNGKN